MEKFKYLWIAFTSDKRQDEKLDVRSGKVSAVILVLHHSVDVKRKLLYGHDSWVMTEKVRSQMQASEMRFLRKIKGATMFGKIDNTVIREPLDIQSLLLWIKRSHHRWPSLVSGMS